MYKAEKIALGREYSELFSDLVAAVLIDPTGLSVGEAVDIRKRLSESGTRMVMLKNRVAKKSLEDTDFEPFSRSFSGMRALVFNTEDVISPAKLTVKIAEDNAEHVRVIGGVLRYGDKIETLDAAGVTKLSKLPSRDELMAKLLFLMNAPVTNFARTLNEIPASFARVLQTIADSK